MNPYILGALGISGILLGTPLYTTYPPVAGIMHGASAVALFIAGYKYKAVS
jgi:hypothetical protein